MARPRELDRCGQPALAATGRAVETAGHRDHRYHRRSLHARRPGAGPGTAWRLDYAGKKYPGYRAGGDRIGNDYREQRADRPLHQHRRSLYYPEQRKDILILALQPGYYRGKYHNLRE